MASNWLTGVVTEVGSGEVDAGELLFAVAGVPVRAVSGEVPFYRDLSQGVSGDDVAQLQHTLAELGHLSGTPDGNFGGATAAAVRQWQRALGVEETGQVRLGEVVALPSFPTTVQFGESIRMGAGLAGGEEAVRTSTGERNFVLVTTRDQAMMIPAEATVEVTFEGYTWLAVIASSTLGEFGDTEFTLTAPDGGAVCGQECEVLPGGEEVTLNSEVIITPPVEGIGVPAAAVNTRADGSAYVITRPGEVDVQVLGSGQGVVIVEGLEEGTDVQVLAEAGAPPDAPRPQTSDEQASRSRSVEE